jgi:ribosome-associated toxin RatA of RatAB toxin-antitoxin module
MREINRSALVAYTPEQMYSLVVDVERYPQFLPWCKAASELKRGPDQVLARLHVHKGPINSHFTTRNRLEPPGAIHMELVEGPFSTLQGEWRFVDIGGKGSRVQLQLRFAFSNPLNAWLLEPVFEGTSNTLLDAFVRRAKQIYG